MPRSSSNSNITSNKSRTSYKCNSNNSDKRLKQQPCSHHPIQTKVKGLLLLLSRTSRLPCTLLKLRDSKLPWSGTVRLKLAEEAQT